MVPTTRGWVKFQTRYTRLFPLVGKEHMFFYLVERLLCAKSGRSAEAIKQMFSAKSGHYFCFPHGMRNEWVSVNYCVFSITGGPVSLTNG